MVQPTIPVYRKLTIQDDLEQCKPTKWIFTKVDEFTDHSSALLYAQSQNRLHSNAIGLWHGSKQHINDFLHVFTLNDDYILDRIFFVGEIPYDKIRTALAQKHTSHKLLMLK